MSPLVLAEFMDTPMSPLPRPETAAVASSHYAVSPAGLRLVQQLVGRPPQSMEELMIATGVTRTAVTEQLNHLADLGFVARATERSGRGRPRYLYSATDDAHQLLFRNNQRLLAPLLIKSMLQVAGPELTVQVLDRVGRQLAEHYLSRMDAGSDTERRVRQLVELLRQEGVVVDLEVDGAKLRIHERTCPYVDAANEDRSICNVEREMMTNVLGVPVVSSSCRLDGCPGCTFEIDVLEIAVMSAATDSEPVNS